MRRGQVPVRCGECKSEGKCLNQLSTEENEISAEISEQLFGKNSKKNKNKIKTFFSLLF